MYILGIESSCDDTSIAILKDKEILVNLISSQHFHSKYGGIVPELASRAHLEVISELLIDALKQANLSMTDINAIGVTTNPGLVGSLLVGANFAKGLSIKYKIPVVPVNHIEGHIYSGNIQFPDLDFPLISLVVSGGHTAIFKINSYKDYELIGSTIDDAAGEAFDKIAKLIGKTYPGGPIIDKLAKSGNAKKYDFPRSLKHQKSYNFSFSGLKTSVRYFVQKEFPNGLKEEDLPDICASVQEAIVDILVYKTILASKEYNIKTIVIGGGVSANSRLREQFNEYKKEQYQIIIPDMEYCLDNAAMIGNIALNKFKYSNKNEFMNLDFTVNSNPIRA
jgi:N6-L-threonylcarbamoyladenine synthase